jgi:NAD-dependent dihydropyrimidine dehydrogenase PreA subunit
MPKRSRNYEIYLIYVDPERCDSCEECVKYCPVEVFEMPHKAVPVRTCVAVCKSKAIIITEI